MSNVNVQNLFSLLILVSLLHTIKSDWDYITEQRTTASRQSIENNFSQTPGDTEITTAVNVEDEKFDDNELKKLFLRNFKLIGNLDRDGNKTEVLPVRKPHRKSRDVRNSTPYYGTECFTCFANITSKSDEKCYEGVSLPSKKCADAEHCYTELNPLYIKRGCILPGRLNRTFICKCPLCNDKPAFDTSHYEYKTINDWEYDNTRLQMPLVGMDLMCKVCETKGTNPTSDKNCRFGKNADYMVCAHNQLCYTNIDDETDFVSRGCMERPLYNSIYFFCNNTGCNDNKYLDPRIKLRHTEQILLKEDPTIPVKPIVKHTTSSKICTIDSSLFLIILIQVFKIYKTYYVTYVTCF